VSLYITAGCDLTVRRPLTPLELAAVRDAIVADAAGPFDMVASAVAAMFAALSGKTTDAEAGRDRYAIPISQWTAIAGAITDRAAAWGAGVEAGMQLAGLLPSSYDDPDTPGLHLACADRRPRISRVEITGEAADTIGACHDRIADLRLAYGSTSSHYLGAASSWQNAVARILGPSSRSSSLVQPAGPLSLIVSADTEPGFAVTFRGEPYRCAHDGCQAIHAAAADTEPLWRPATPAATVREHDHEPHYPFGGPQPGIWVQHS
jgi:hypothetical protein